MGMFIRVTLVVAAAVGAFIVLAFILKLLVIAAIIAAVAVGGIMLVRSLRARLGANWRGRVTGLSARR